MDAMLLLDELECLEGKKREIETVPRDTLSSPLARNALLLDLLGPRRRVICANMYDKHST